MLKVTVWLFLVGGLVVAGLAALVLILLVWRERSFVSDEFFRQTLVQILSGVASGILIAIISFGSAYALYRIQEGDKISDARMDSFIKIKDEVSENRLTLGQELKQDRPLVRLPLKTAAWEMGKYQAPIKTPLLLDGLKLLYDLIEKYNWHLSFVHFKVMEKDLTQDKVPEEIWKSEAAIMGELYSKLEEFEKLTSRELVLLGQSSRKQYEERFGPWQDEVAISFFIRPANKGHQAGSQEQKS